MAPSGEHGNGLRDWELLKWLTLVCSMDPFATGKERGRDALNTWCHAFSSIDIASPPVERP